MKTEYDSKNVRVFFGDREIVGLAPDSVIQVEPATECSPVVREWTFKVWLHRRWTRADLVHIAWGALVVVEAALVIALAAGAWFATWMAWEFQ